MAPPTTSRDFTVATFVVAGDRVLLLFHRKLQMWLPPGGHIEPNELPDEAAVREVLEEAGIAVRLLPEIVPMPSGPLPLARPEGIQLERIGPDHEHIDLIYFAVPEGDMPIREHPREASRAGWYAVRELEALGVNAEVRRWSERAVETVAARLGTRR
jgi:8-oxo-dGTP pyrophosphatase MutT (NUDIX family)